MKILSSLFFFFFLLSCQSQQSDSTLLAISDFEYILSKIDTTRGQNNYHMLLNDGYSHETRVLTVWINDRLGSSILIESGYSICNFFKNKEGYVYVYKDQDCFVNIAPGYINELGDDPYSYLQLSPMHVEGGFEMKLLIEKKGSSILIWKLDLLNEGELIIDEDDF